MDRLKELLEAISRTLNTLTVDNAGGNWGKLLGCLNACNEGIRLIGEMTSGKEGDE